MSPSRPRAYALILVLMVLALLSVGLGALFVYQEGSASTTGSLLERRRVFYACDGIGRAATVMAQSYMTTAVPTTQGLIDFVCGTGGGGCCATTTDTSSNPTAGTCQAIAGANNTRLTAAPGGSGPTALPLIVPTGFKIMELTMSSGRPCSSDVDCPVPDGHVTGTPLCVNLRCQERAVAPLPNGPFEGMNARQDTFSIGIVAEHRATTRFRCATEQSLTLGKIAMFQFFVFSDSPTTDWYPGPRMEGSGRVHVNGNLCLAGGNTGLFLERVTVAGELHHMGDAACPVSDSDTNKTFIANRKNPDFSNSSHFENLSVGDRAKPDWTSYARDLWKGQALDSAHGVPRLKLPIVGSPVVQGGQRADSSLVSNAQSSRVLVDPWRPTDPAEVLNQKFAFKADIRIINGIWYLKNVAAPNQWPGVPVWSDHGGQYTARAATDMDGNGSVDANEADLEVGNNTGSDRQVGQAQLVTNRSWGSRVPRRFSYYATVPSADRLLFEDLGTANYPEAIVSYGTLVRRGSSHTATWRPGVRSLFQNNGTASNRRYSFCGHAPVAAASSTAPWFQTILDAYAMPCDGTQAQRFKTLDTAGVTTATNASAGAAAASAILGATRSGFRDGHHQRSLGGGQNGSAAAVTDVRANVLPMNFDVAAFQRALRDKTKGELGFYFCDTGGCACTSPADRGCIPRPFNGIVWISNTYYGSESGYPDDLPDLHAGQGAVSDSGQPAASRDGSSSTSWDNENYRVLSDLAGRAANTDNEDNCQASSRENCVGDEQEALPWHLCSESGGTAAPGTTMTTANTFRRPDCAFPTRTSRPNAVRIINARNLNMQIASEPVIPVPAGLPGNLSQVTLPVGISIVSNQRVYVVGDVNLASNPDGNFPALTAPDDTTSATWWPFLVGGDVVHLVSNAWDDRRSRWSLSTGNRRYLDLTASGAQVQPMAGANDPADDDSARRAQESWYYMQILGGWGQPFNGVHSGGVHNFPRFIEDWAHPQVRARFRGSIVVGWDKVYAQYRWNCCDRRDYDPPLRDWGFDEMLNDLEKQPPGTPVYDVAAVRQWTRR